VTRTASDPEGLKVARAASKGSQDAAASQKWSLRPRQISAQRLGDTKKRQRSDVLSDDQASDFPDDVSTFSAVSAQVPGAASIISDAKASLNTWFSAQEARCQSSLQFPPRRRCSHKMRLHEVYLGREAKVREVLGRRSKTLRSIYREEVRKMRAELAEVQKRQSEEIHGLEAATGARENAAAERKRQILAHQAAMEQARAKLDALSQGRAAARSRKVEAAAESRRRQAAVKQAPISPPAEGPVSPRLVGSRSAKADVPMSPRPVGSRSARAEAPKAVSESRPAVTASAGSSSRPAGLVSEPLQAAPVSPKLPEKPAFVEFVGAPVGKGTKVPSGMWPWPTSDVLTRSRARQL